MNKPNIYIFLFILTILITFSPLVLTPNVHGPWLFGMPRTLWFGILSSFIIAILTLLISIHYHKED